MSKLHVTGPARSGTTLMKHLMNCFSECIVVPGESMPPVTTPDRTLVVSKFPENGPELYEKYPDLNVILMVRDPRDLLVSRLHGVRWWNDRERRQPGILGRVLRDSLTLAQDPRTRVIRYEDLVSEPDTVQRVIADRYWLTPLRAFSEGHIYFPNEESLNGVRPPDTNSVGVWRAGENKGVVKAGLASSPDAYRYMQAFGYEEA